jgi:hypothetical protein
VIHDAAVSEVIFTLDAYLAIFQDDAKTPGNESERTEDIYGVPHPMVE